ncbi:MAG TPA: cell division protein SepF [Candidatus Thermoplasmatota archaeon]|nr:cell division protein SepF [Candidatus Thermoplasmatota archaeon]
MSIVKKLFGEDSSNGRAKGGAGHDRDYIDLSDYAAAEKATGEGGAAATYIKFAQVRALDDLKRFASIVYDGNMLVLDIKAVQGDEILLRRLSNELRKLASDTGGDIAGLGEHHILLTPTGIKVDRRQYSVDKETGEMSGSAPRGAPAAPVAAVATPVVAAGTPPRANGTRGARPNVGR